MLRFQAGITTHTCQTSFKLQPGVGTESTISEMALNILHYSVFSVLQSGSLALTKIKIIKWSTFYITVFLLLHSSFRLFSISFLTWVKSNSYQHKPHQDMETMLPDQISNLGWDLEASWIARLQIFLLTANYWATWFPFSIVLWQLCRSTHSYHWAKDLTLLTEKLYNNGVIIITEYKIKPALRKLTDTLILSLTGH